MTLGYDRELFLLAFDHRASFSKGLFGIAGTPTPDQADRVRDAKAVIYEGFLRAFGAAPAGSAGVLVDEEYGAQVAAKARAQGAVLAMPVEKSGQEVFDFEYGEAFAEHVEAFDPAFTKVLVRYNPDGDAAANELQAGRLARLSRWLRQHDRKFVFELLVPATPAQLAEAGGDTGRYDAEARPALVARAIAALQAADVEPDVWKIEGLERAADCELVAAQARAGGRDQVACIVLGRGADEAKVGHWLREGARTPGFRGFAIGRTLWWGPLAGWRDGTLDRDGATGRIAENYLRAIEVYRQAAGA